MPVTLATDCQIRRPAAGFGDPAGARCDFCPYFLRRYKHGFLIDLMDWSKVQ